jgi:hypothetical protein
MSYQRWSDEISRGGWGTGGNRREIMADWRADRIQRDADLREANAEIKRLREELNRLKKEVET